MPKATGRKIDPSGKVKTNRTNVQPPPSLKQRLSIKKVKPPASPSSEISDEDQNSDNGKQPENGTEGEEEEDGVHLYGFSENEDDSDSSNDDDEEGVDHHAGVDVGKLPTVARDDETVKRKLEKAKKNPAIDRGVIYLGRIPHGFYEDQMRQYFTQFGDITRLRLSRSKKTGRSKHYAFIEFDSSAVAQIVSETMDNYLLMGHLLICKVVPKEKVHPELWIGANRKWRRVPIDRVLRVAHNRERNFEERQQAERRLLKRQKKKASKLEQLGIKYDITAVGYQKPAATSV